MDRLGSHAALSDALSRLQDGDLASLLARAEPGTASTGGRASLLALGDTTLFVKRIPLTDLERRPENVGSTLNLGDIPLVCHYGMGGPGFSAWRELAASLIATGWVASGACGNFPLLHHWRVLPAAIPQPADEGTRHWSDSDAVQARQEALGRSTADLVLFFEHVPQNLLEWLSGRLSVGPEAAREALAFVDRHLEPTIAFMNERGLTHFDPHFENILTDGERLYFADFGLALSSDFDLTPDEREFLDAHRRYDYGRAAVGYAHCLSAASFGGDRWRQNLLRFLDSGEPALSPVVERTLRREAPLALAFLEFSARLQAGELRTRYPASL